MGYTHYWYRTRELDSELFAAAMKDCRMLCESLPIPLGDGAGKGQPVFDASDVCFNGHVSSHQFATQVSGLPWPGDNAKGLANSNVRSVVSGTWYAGDLLSQRACPDDGDGSFEAFHVSRVHTPYSEPENGLYLEFCKTEFRPYDLNVQVCLIVFNHHFADQFHVASDGSEAQWDEPRHVCQSVLEYGADFRLIA